MNLKNLKNVRKVKKMLNPNNYNKLFRINGDVTALHSEFFLKKSIGLGDSLIIHGNGTWHTFIEKEGEKR